MRSRKPKFISSPYFDREGWALRAGAPEKLRSEFALYRREDFVADEEGELGFSPDFIEVANPGILHYDHRSRVKERFLAEGLEAFAPHNILELLLFYSIPQKDVNEIAHLLINTFGSVSAVMDASFEELCRVNGIKENSATLIKLAQALVRHYTIEKSSVNVVLDTREKMGEYLVAWYTSLTVETVLLLCLDNRCDLIYQEVIHQGSVNSASVSVRRIAEVALAHNAASIVLAHNHPRGLPIPSPEDISTTRALKSAMRTLEIDLAEHFVVAERKFVGILTQ